MNITSGCAAAYVLGWASAAGRLGAEIKQLWRCSAGAFWTANYCKAWLGVSHSTLSGQKSSHWLNHCPVRSKVGIRNNSALKPSFEKLPGKWVLTPLLVVWGMQMLSPARPSPSLNSKLGDLLHRALAGWLEALRSPLLVALPAQDDKAASWDSSAISSHCPSQPPAGSSDATPLHGTF